MDDRRTSETPVAGPTIVRYEVRHEDNGWAIFHDGERLGTLDTRVAAFDHIVSAIRSSLIEGYEINVKLEREPTYPI